MNAFVDTNVLIDFVCRREDFYKVASIIFDLAHTRKIELSVSTLSFINAYYIGVKYKHPAAEMQRCLNSVRAFVTVSSLDDDMLAKALSQGVDYVEDAAQYHSALSVYADCIVTRNKKDFAFSKIPVYSPEELLELIL